MAAEAWGTGLIVIFGVGSVCSAITSGSLMGLWQVATVWGFGVGLAIYCTCSVSGAHLNPAVSLALAIWRDFPLWKLGPFVFAQMMGAILAAFVNFLMFHEFFDAIDKSNNAERGDPASIFTAAAFGEYYPNPGPFGGEWRKNISDGSEMMESTAHALLVEAWGTFVLMFVILCITDGRHQVLKQKEMAPFLIGFCVACLISVYAPLTQAGWNPARDFGPRITAWLLGYGEIAIPGPRGGFWVYILGPCLGAPLAVPVYDLTIAPGLPETEEENTAQGRVVKCKSVDGKVVDCQFANDGSCCPIGGHDIPVGRGPWLEVNGVPVAQANEKATLIIPQPQHTWGPRYERNVMFLCNHNSCRSQMADAWLRHLRGNSSFGVASAGIVGGTAVKEGAITVMKEVGIDISQYTSDAMADFAASDFDTVISCCGCGSKLDGEKQVWKQQSVFEDWNLDDPPAIDPGDLSAYRRVRDEIKAKVLELLAAPSEPLWGPSYKHNVMFLCNHNSCRSQMADAWLRHLRGNSSVGVASAGIVGGTEVKPGAITVMKEVGIDISAYTSDAMADFEPGDFDIVISCCGCGSKLDGDKEVWKKRSIFEDWNLDDPPAIDPGDLSAYRRVRDECKAKVQKLIDFINE
jgi:glycerol uptake facilitator protein